MKSVLALALFAMSCIAFAEPVRIGACNFADYQKINSSLEQIAIESGREFKDQLQEILMQEMGPECSRLLTVELPPSSGLMSAYEIDNRAGDVFYISIVEDSSFRPDSVTITKK